MADVQALIEQGKAAIKAGQKAQAKTILTQAVEADEQSEQAWLWLSACVDTVEEQQICLENVIAINPANEKAKKGLAALSAKGPSKPVAAVPPPAPAAPPKPAAPAFPTDGFGDFDANPFAGTGFDSNPYGTSSDPALDSQWDSFGASTDDSFSSAPTSVDWGRDSGPAAYGSGKDVPQPGPDEYDDWVSNLSLGGSSSTPETDFNPASGPFGAGDSFDFDSFSNETSSPSAPESSATVSTNVSPFDDFDFSNFDASSSSAFGSSFDAGSSAGPFSADPNSVDLDSVPDPFGSGFGRTSSPVQSPVEDHDDPFGSAASIDLDSDPFADLGPEANQTMFGASKPASSGGGNAFGNSRATVFGGAMPEKQEAAAGGFAFIDSNAAPSKEAYFSAIPPEIQADGPAGKPSVGLMVSLGVLALLNVISFALLFQNFTKP